MKCETTGMPETVCNCAIHDDTPSEPSSPSGFSTVLMGDVKPSRAEFLIPDLIIKGKLHVLIGEEGIGKGLWSAYIIASQTQRGHRVTYINGEDDLSDTLHPRLTAARANLNLVEVLCRDPKSYVGVPKIPTDLPAIETHLTSSGCDLMLIDPWISIVDGRFTIKDPQRAREILDPLSGLAARTGVPIVLVVHPNRGEGSLRDRVGLTGVLRQAARVAIWILEDPQDDSLIYVGVEKSNGVARKPATRFRKQPSDPSRPDQAWFIADPVPTSLTILEWDDHFHTLTDGRTTDRWDDIEGIASTNGRGRITRQEIIEVYREAGSSGPEKAADGVIARWTHGELPRLKRVDGEPGVFVVPGWAHE